MATNPNPQRVTISDVTSFLQSLGFNPIQAAGIAGNLSVETGNFDPNVINGRRRGDNGTAFGMMQWRNDRQTKFYQFARELGESPYNWQTQLKFVKAEMVPGRYSDPGSVRAMRELQNAKTVLDATKAFVHAERPAGYSVTNPERSMHFKERFQAAQRGYSASGQGPQQPMEEGTRGSTNPLAVGDFDDPNARLMSSLGETDSWLDEQGYDSYENEELGVFNTMGGDPSTFSGLNPLGFSDFGNDVPYNLQGRYSNLNNLYSYDTTGGMNRSTRSAFGI